MTPSCGNAKVCVTPSCEGALKRHLRRTFADNARSADSVEDCEADLLRPLHSASCNGAANLLRHLRRTSADGARSADAREADLLRYLRRLSAGSTHSEDSNDACEGDSQRCLRMTSAESADTVDAPLPHINLRRLFPGFPKKRNCTCGKMAGNIGEGDYFASEDGSDDDAQARGYEEFGRENKEAWTKFLPH